MNNYFDGIDSIEKAKKLYRKLALELHPDQGGNEEEFKIFQNDFESFLKTFMQTAVNDWMKKNNKDFDINAFTFAKVIKDIIDLNIRIEIIGFWIYAFESKEVKDILKEKGFWFSSKHKAWVFSGTKKKNWRTKNSTNDIRNMHGCTTIREKEEYLKLASV